ncbi:MAG: methylenetetrahydrofolate reductase [Geodermatophilaceae bacterium]|nr:methylenetetrahydrofolate reductase [Geodermatophilaceae bacterium]MDQ3464791.1 methylenetetrahydrofolate reductase [Actinomycetota bacterium]
MAADDLDGEVLASALAELTRGFSVEVTPREAPKVQHFGEVLAEGTRVYITFLANTPFEDTLALARRAVDEGMRPVPHLAVRSIPSRRALTGMVAALADVGATEMLVIAGSVSKPAGEYEETMQVLASGVLPEHGITRIGVAGHPEGAPDISATELAAALAAKNAVAAEQGLDLYIVTQFSFAPEPIVEWEREIRAAGNRLPIVIGLPGLTSPAKLLKFGLSCGIGPSLKVLRKQSGGVLKLATSSVYHPDQTMLGLVRSRVSDPASLISGVHFFPFGSLERTAEWARQVSAGQFVVDTNNTLRVTA